LSLHTPAPLQPEAGDYRLFVNVDPAAASVHHVHRTPLSARRAGECYRVRVYLARSSSLIGREHQFGVPEAQHSGPFCSGLNRTSNPRPWPGSLRAAEATTFISSRVRHLPMTFVRAS